MALQLCRRKHRSLHNPSLVHLFSTSQNDDNNNNNNNSSPSRLNSYLSDVKSSLKRQQQPKPPIFSKPVNKEASFEEIRKNLAEFRQRASVPPPTEQNMSRAPSQHMSFQELYKRNANTEGKTGGKFSFDAIRESLRQMKSNNTTNNINNTGNNNMGKNADSFSLSAFKNSLRLKPQDGSTVIGGTQELPVSVFGKEMKQDKSGGDRGEMKTEFVKMYSYDELGQKLKKLRPDGFQGEFSLEELNERLMRLREMEEKESESRIVGVTFKDLRESLVRLKKYGDEKAKKSSAQRLDILGQLGGTPDFMLHPPKEHLVEQFLHPDNMSSAEKMKIELAKVREEFKMSESDCGSARVQVAQLTKKIKHLSSVLHKKDKHSLKGLHAMVQRRKRLLKYLRRTDWDSYCLVLSKLGLRDNPDYKAT